MSYAAADLLCYRAAGPRGLVEAQTKHWDPVLAWAKSALAAPLKLGQGIVHVAQPQASLDRLKETLAGRDPFSLAALHVMTGLTGSALLALAVASGQMTPEEAWKAAHVDEDWQIAQWGEDEEAAARRANRRRDFAAAARCSPCSIPPPERGEGGAHRAPGGGPDCHLGDDPASRPSPLHGGGRRAAAICGTQRPCYAP